MSIIVEHEKRRYEILEKALEAFMDEGFEDVTFQKIADRCGITRTTLYAYFRNKREIFNFSIKQFLQILENDISDIRKKTDISQTEKLIEVMLVVIERLEENRPILSVILDYLVNNFKEGFDPDDRVRRRTVRLRHILATMLIEGIKKGEFNKDIDLKDANEMLYTFFESAIYRLAILRRSGVGELKDAMKQAVQGFRANQD